MKTYKMLITLMTFGVLTSCEENLMDWSEDETKGEVTTAELPLQMAEKIGRYESLNKYLDGLPENFKLGVGVGASLYQTKEIFRNTANENFQELTVGYHMKHGPMVQANGSLDFAFTDAFMDLAKAAGKTVFGHTLVWHSNQDASYLNGLIAPTIIPGSSGSNIMDISGLEDGSFNNWARNNPGAGISIEEGEGLGTSASGLVMTASSSSSNPWDLQLGSPQIAVDSSHSHQLTFYVKSDQPGQGRISFQGLENNYPYKDWYRAGGDWTEAFTTSTEWQKVDIDISDFADTKFSFSLDFGYNADVTYSVDISTLVVVDKEAAGQPTNILTNGDFEAGNIDGWGGWGNSSTREVSASGEGYNSSYAMTITNPTVADPWSAQQVYDLPQALAKDTAYTCTFMIKSSAASVIQLQLQNPADFSADYFSDVNVGTEWTAISLKMTPTTDDRSRLVFDLGANAVTYYIDDVMFTDGTSGLSETIVIEKTDEEKATIIENAMTHWISEMVGHYKGDIKAWDVVNEPVKENGELRDGNVTDPPADHFYWVKYMGRDYAAKAFILAREHGNEDDILFINDYNLEYSLDKCDGLINYVKEIETVEGARVDGIGTQMHISFDSDKDKIVQMFQKLAATGKLIKISELDVRLKTATPSLELLTQQEEMYRFVIDKYREIIPESQQYGITIWGVSDHPDEHINWLTDQSPNLWDANFERKPAYKGVADGLAGKDVSADFTGELIID